MEKIESPVVVEGKSDAEALRELGVEDIITLQGKPLYKVSEDLSERTDEVVILTDYDREGRKLAKKLNNYFTSYGVLPNRRIRRKLGFLINKIGISHIEDIKPHKMQNQLLNFK